MTNTMNDTIDKARQTLFVVKQQEQQLISAKQHAQARLENGKTSAHLLFNDIVRCACLPNHAASIARLALINQNAAWLEQYLWALRKISVSVSPAQAAASTHSDALKGRVRQTELFELGIVQASSETKTGDVDANTNINNASRNPKDAAKRIAEFELNLVQLSDTQKKVGCHLHVLHHDNCAVISFDTFVGKTARRSVPVDSVEYRLLTDPDAIIYLT